MFYAMAAEKIDLRGFTFEHILQDIQTLNERATRGELDISAVSIHACSYVLDKYALLACGASMGDNYGPLLVTLDRTGLVPDADDETIHSWLQSKRIAIPGKLTSATLALGIYAGELNTVVIPFDKIFDALREGAADVGLLIHEGQLTYARDGFLKVRDLGEWWFEKTGGLPLPLGGNGIRRGLPEDVTTDLAAILKESIRYGLEHRADGVRHSMPLARGMDESLADKFIGMYVNEFTLDYGDRGRAAIRRFLSEGHGKGLIPEPVEIEFVH